MSIVGDNLRFYRIEHHMTQEALGKAIGHATGSYVSAIERDAKHPTDGVLGKLAATLGVSLDDLRHPRTNLLPVTCG